MSRVRYFPMVVVGLAGLASQAEMLSRCHAADSVSASASNDTEYADQVDDHYVDKSVVPAGFYDSRPRPGSAAAGIQSSATNRGGAMFRGQKVKLPTSLFGRQSAKNPTMARLPQGSGPIAAPMNTGRPQLQAAKKSSTAAHGMPQRLPAAAPAATGANFQTARAPSGRPQQPVRQAYAPHPAASKPNAPVMRPATSAPAIPNSSVESPWAKPTQAAPTAKSVAAPVTPMATPVSPARAQSAAPLSAADRIVAEAHELSTRAESEEDYTHIIETCRRAQASQASPATTQYAKNLISWSLNRRGQLRAEACQEKEAILDFDDAIRTDPTCWRALHNRGVLLAQAGKFEKAFDDFSHAIQINPQFAKAYSNRAALFMVANNLDAALADYKRCIELDPELAVAHRGCGRVCQLLGHADEAVAHYDAAVQLAPTDAYAAACRADMLTDVGRYSDAIAEYERAIEIDPNSNQAQGGSAWLLATCPDSAIRNPELAVERAKTVIDQGGDKDAINFDTLAAAQASAGDFAAAMDTVRKAIELAPTDERDTYKDRLIMYQQARPYRIAPIERVATQVSYETVGDVEGVAR